MMPSHGDGINVGPQKHMELKCDADACKDKNALAVEEVANCKDDEDEAAPAEKPSTFDFSTHFVIHRQPASSTQLDQNEETLITDETIKPSDETTSAIPANSSDEAGMNPTAIISSKSVVSEINDGATTAAGANCTPPTPPLDKECAERGGYWLRSSESPPPVSAPTAFSSRRVTSRVSHPFMGSSRVSSTSTAMKIGSRRESTKVKLPSSPMDTFYEPISAYCIQEKRRKLEAAEENSSADGLRKGSDSNPSPLAITLKACEQRSPIPLETIFNELRDLKKIGEGVYGEVYSGTFRCFKEFTWVYKVVAVGGEDLVNGERQKNFTEILPEIVVSQKLNQLRTGYNNCQTNSYVFMRNARIGTGKYPSRLVKSWEAWNEEYESDNDKPEFLESQLYMVLEFEFAGQDIESIVFKDARQSLSIVLQVAHILAVGECAFEFEHRDLHWGNIMVETWKTPNIFYVLDGQTLHVPAIGVKVVVIDFTLARLKDADGSIICLDLVDDDEQFLGTGDHQFDIYRMMRDYNRNEWQKYCPKSNIYWLHYLAHKFSVKGHYMEKNNEGEDHRQDMRHRKAVEKLTDFCHFILEHGSATDFVRSKECEGYRKFLVS